MKFLIAFLSIFASFAAQAEQPGNGTTLQIFRDKLKPKTVVVENLKNKTSILSKTPHRQLNPEGKTAEFEGISINKLLKLTTADQDKLVHFIGVDGYISTIPASVLLKTDAILALKENGEPLNDRQGGIQVVFPTEGDKAVESRYAKKAAFWCWYVRSVVVGDLSNKLKVGKSDFQIKNAQSFAFEPPSGFQFEKRPCPNTVRVPLSAVTRAKEVSLHLLSGDLKAVPTDQFDLVLTEDKTALPVNCGGPFAVVDHNQLATLKPPILAKNLETGVSSIEAKN